MSVTQPTIETEYNMDEGSDDLRAEFDGDFEWDDETPDEVGASDYPVCTGTDSVCCEPTK